MEKDTKLILPYLPKNLEALHKNEEKIRTYSILQINANSNLKEHIEIVHDSLNLIHDFIISYKNQNDDELIIQYLGTRLFNSITSSIKLLLTGYYQGSVVFQRDILEVGYLLDFFSIDKSKISDWKQSDKQQLYNKYGPAKIRKKLDNRDGLLKGSRNQMYQIMCAYAVHVTYPGSKLVAPKKLLKTGPFFDLNYLTFIIQELAMNVPLFTLIYVRHFKNIPTDFQEIKSNYLNKVKIWAKKYLKLDLIKIDNALIKEWVKTTTAKTRKIK